MKKYKVIISIVILILMIPIGYITIGHKYVDEQLYKSAKSEINDFIENPYTGSIKDGVTEKELDKVNKKINFIYNKPLKSKLLSETDSIVKQANLQTSLKTETSKYYDSETPNGIDDKRINELIDLSGSVKNNNVRIKILQKNYDVLDRIQKDNKAKNSVDKLVTNKDKLTSESLKDYYISVGLVNAVYYESTKEELTKSLKDIDKKLTDIIKVSNKSEEDSVNNEINKIKNGYYSFQVSNSETNKLTESEYSSYEFFNTNTSIKYLIIINKNSLDIFENNESLNNKSIKNEVINNKLSKSVSDGLKNNFLYGFAESDFLITEDKTVDSSNKEDTSNSSSETNDSSTDESSTTESTTNITKSVKVITSSGANAVTITTDSNIPDSIIVSQDMYDFIKSIISNEVALIG